MLNILNKNRILILFEAGHSKSAIARELGISRTTVIKYLQDDQKLQRELNELEEGSVHSHEIMEKIAGAPEYSGKNKMRKKRKYTEEIDKRIDEILEDEARKDREYGPSHKLQKTAKQIHEILEEEGYEVSYSTICKEVRKKKEKKRETFIQQNYFYGERVEFDFGERIITIGGKKHKVFAAVFAFPVSGHREYFLYPNSKMEVFVDAHSQFFEKVGGVPETIVYDNMKNVIIKFVGRNERELTGTVLSLSNYYKFKILVTNPYRGNEKGTVESSVKVVLRDLFARRDIFDSWEDVLAYAEERRPIINKNSRLKEEKAFLKPTRMPYEAAQISEHRVNKYAFVRVDKNDYSVPEEYSGGLVNVKLYPYSVEIYSKGKLIAFHKRIFGENQSSVQIAHYLKTMLRKPGAVSHSTALQQEPKLYNIFNTYYSEEPRKFLEILIDNKDLLDTEQIYEILLGKKDPRIIEDHVEERSKTQLDSVMTLFQGHNHE